jgi:hypothetical protein
MLDAFLFYLIFVIVELIIVYKLPLVLHVFLMGLLALS